jgi:hypothetical protein
MPRQGWRVAAVVGVLLLTSGSGVWAQPGRMLRGRSCDCDGCADRCGKPACGTVTACRPGVLRELLERLDASLQEILPCDRCRCCCPAICEAPACDSRPTCGCAEKSEIVLPPTPPGHSPLLEDNPFRDDTLAPRRPRPTVKARARTASARADHNPAVDASSTHRGEPRPLPRLLDAAPLRVDKPAEPSVLRKSDRTAASPGARPELTASPAVHFVPLDRSTVDFYTRDHEPIVRPVQASTADALGVANQR